MGLFEIFLFVALAVVVYIIINKARSCGFISPRWFGGRSTPGSCNSDSEHSPSELNFDDEEEDEEEVSEHD